MFKANIQCCMQVSIYVRESDFETMSKHKPDAFKTTSSFMSDVLSKKAESLRKENKE